MEPIDLTTFAIGLPKSDNEPTPIAMNKENCTKGPVTAKPFLTPNEDLWSQGFERVEEMTFPATDNDCARRITDLEQELSVVYLTLYKNSDRIAQAKLGEVEHLMLRLKKYANAQSDAPVRLDGI